MSMSKIASQSEDQHLLDLDVAYLNQLDGCIASLKSVRTKLSLQIKKRKSMMSLIGM